MVVIRTMRLNLIATWFFLIVSSVASPVSSFSTSANSMPLNSSYSTNGVESVTVCPRSRDRLDELDREIRAVITKGTVEALTSQYSSDFKGIVVWFVEAEHEEIELLRSKVDGIDIQPDDIVIQQQDVDAADSDIFTVPANGSSPNLELVRAVTRQTNAPADLRVISWPPEVSFESLKSYAYEATTARDTYIYLIDRGLDPNNVEFSGMTHPPEEWHYGRKVPENVRTDDDPSSHGSCVASKAAGVVNGVSKRSHLVMLKIDNSAPNVIWAFNTALNDIVSKKRQGRAVIAYPNTAISPSPAGFPPYPWSYAYSYMQDLFRNDVPVVVPSGNFALERGRPVDTLPATMERATDPKYPLIVTGSVNNYGTLADFSQGPNHVTIWSPGVKVRCAAKGSSRGVQEISGTSFSTGTVAGFLAYALGLPDVPFTVGGGTTASNAKAFLQNVAGWRRMQNGPNVVWNNQNGALKGSHLNISIF